MGEECSFWCGVALGVLNSCFYCVSGKRASTGHSSFIEANSIHFSGPVSRICGEAMISLIERDVNFVLIRSSIAMNLLLSVL